MPPRSSIAIDFFRRRLRAVEATITRGSIHVNRVISVEIPEEIPLTDDESVGRWIRDALLRRGMEVGRAVVAVNRDDAVVRRITLPTREVDELADMVALSMKRDLPIDAEHAEIDYIVLDHSDVTTDVLACAIPTSVLERVDAVVAAAGITASRVSLRCFGTAALVNSLPATRGRSILAIDLGEDGFEFVVSRNGAIGFTRGVETRPGSSGIDETIVTEVRRSWISHRLSERDDEEVTTGVLFGPLELTKRLEGWIGEATGLDIKTISEHPRAKVTSEFPGDAWPLVGLLLRDAQRLQTIDFTDPRHAPDLAARRRQQILVGCGAILIAGLIGWTLGNLQISSTRGSNLELEGKARSALTEYYRNRRDMLRIDHLEAWDSVRPDWIEHIASFQTYAPDQSRVVVDGFTGTLLTDSIDYSEDDGFQVEALVRLDIDGESLDRSTVDSLRSELVEEDHYLLRSTGSETAGGRRLSFPFSFQLMAPVELPSPEAGGGDP